jgi:hypothetical protein
VAKHSSHRGRSRKRRSRAAAAPKPPLATLEQAPAASTRGREQRPRARRAQEREQQPFRAPNTLGERPQALWHPLPLSELLIFVGAIATVIGFARGAAGHVPLFAGIGAVAIGTTEVSLREHLSGYRSHTIILALIPTLVLHSLIALVVSAFTRVPGVLNLSLLALDVAVFAVVFKLLRTRFVDARRERTFAAAR